DQLLPELPRLRHSLRVGDGYCEASSLTTYREGIVNNNVSTDMINICISYKSQLLFLNVVLEKESECCGYKLGMSCGIGLKWLPEIVVMRLCSRLRKTSTPRQI